MPNINNINANAEDSAIVAGIKQFQTYINNNLPSEYLGTPLVVNGVCGSTTKIAAVKLIQYYINTTYGECLEIDGHFGPSSQIAFNRYKGVIRYRETGFWVYMLQGLLYCHGYDPKGFDGSYGAGGGTGCLNAVNAYKVDNYINEYPGTGGEVGVETFASLCWKSWFAQKTYYIRNKANGLYLCHYGTSMTLSAYTGLDNQKWQFNYMDNGEFRLISMEDNVPTSGQYVYALNASSSTYVNAQPGDAALLSQRWVLNGKMDNIRIISKVYGTALNAAGPLIVTLSNQNTINERWELIEASNPYMLPYIEGELSVNKINNTTLRSNMNCYSYALGYYTYERDYLQPGKLSGAAFSFYDFQSYFDYYYDRVVISEEGIEAIIEAIINKVNNDLNVLCGDSTSVQRIYPSSLNERIVGPWKKVALVIDPVSFTFSSMFHDFDYHWYIQHEDGKWSHKRGTTNAYVTDNSAAIITNPETCNRDYGIYNYSIFAGYYKIRIDAVIHDGKRSSNDMYKWDNAGDIASMSNSLSLISSSSPAIVSGSIEYWNIVLPNTGASEPDSDRYCWQGDIDWYEFMVNEAGVYVIRTYGNNGLYGVLYEGKTFMQSSSGVYMQVALSPEKLYKLKILGVSSGNNGDYTLSIVKS